MAYEQVNRQWPETVPALDPEEAVAAAKRLYRFAMKRAWRGKWKTATGNRLTWPRSGTFYVNPARRNVLDTESGWRDVVHLMSHWCHHQLHPNAPSHGSLHRTLEKDMIEYVIKSGWLDGRLKPRVTPAVSKIDVRHKNVLAGIERWSTKLKRAQTALRKLNKQRKYYERRTTQGSV